jgi:hypothetical protein
MKIIKHIYYTIRAIVIKQKRKQLIKCLFLGHKKRYAEDHPNSPWYCSRCKNNGDF